MALLELRREGLYCEAGDFYLDPWEPVARAVISHAHADHARSGSNRFWATDGSASILRHRLGAELPLESKAYGETFELARARVSFHPSGHVLGAAQVRVEAGGEVWVFSGDYKRASDPTCAPFEVVPCDGFVTEATFALPIYRWDDPAETIGEIFAWWERNRAAGRCSVLFCYTLGKAQRLLAELARLTTRTVFIHGALEAITDVYRAAGVAMLATDSVTAKPKGHSFAGELVLAPLSARGSVWMRRLGEHEEAFASGWMRLRGPRRKRAFDRGFALSDHADWPALLQTVKETGARSIRVTHGYSEPLARYLREQGLDAQALATRFTDEEED